MDDEELFRIASRLDAASELEPACSRLSTGKPWLWLSGNRHGLLRFAAGLIRAAATPIAEGEDHAEPTFLEHQQINNTSTEYTIGGVQRVRELAKRPDVTPDRKRNMLLNDHGALVGCGVVSFVILILLLSGIAFWWNIIAGATFQ